MLKLSHITKIYAAGGSEVEALRDISLEFRKSEFVSVLGPSGCGKTTLLNIIGGLDRYTSGALLINNVSTKEYTDTDWDIYRNTSIGFVFQNYNLISHQTVLANVELALTLAGIPKEELRKCATDALIKVGLGDQLHKKPNQMSGGQMQRVAIARALVNNPEILLADEPTGALDSETSTQIMAILKEIAKDRLVVMVTHNADLADEYSTRIIRLLDGKVISDTDPYKAMSAITKIRKGRKKKRSMSFFTALSLSMNNLLTKKTRTVLTAFAGSIGIIGIALILSLSSGMNAYITNIQKDTLSTYPIQIESQSMDLSGLMSSVMETNNRGGVDHDLDAIYSNNVATEMQAAATTQIARNDLREFKAYLDSGAGQEIISLSSTVQYGYDLDLLVYAPDTSDGVVQINPSDIYETLGITANAGGGGSFGMGSSASDVWEEMLGNSELLESQYDVIAGKWPEAYDEIVIVVDENNEISDTVLYSLGLMDIEVVEEYLDKTEKGEAAEPPATARIRYDDLLSLRYKLVLQSATFGKDGESGLWTDQRDDKDFMKAVLDDALELRVVGILRPNPEASAGMLDGTVAYTSDLMSYVISQNETHEIVKEQRADPDANVFTTLPFAIDEYTSSLTMDDINAFVDAMEPDEQAQVREMMAGMTDEEILAQLEETIKADAGTGTYADNLSKLGVVDYDSPSVINIYPLDFEAKETISALIEGYNAMQKDAGHDEYTIRYTDFIGLMTSSITSIINIISYVLIAFVSISLVVSSIMIGIITYISVLERTKEIGILRSIGASKRDISRVFNAETVIVGLVAGVLGVGITMLLNIPINALIKLLAGVSGIASLPLYGAIGLVASSVLLTLAAGLIPSRVAARKDPVEALRTE